MVRSVIATVLLLAAGLPCSAQAPTVNTSSGSLQGVREGPVDAYLGIPYAQPPIGPLRWQPPLPVSNWAATRDATHFSASCFQPWPAPVFGPYTPEYLDTPRPNEDCLYLNVWTPRLPHGPLPVFVWIHGGGFLGGSAAIEIYNGQHLAAQGAVVVSINYRVGPFGFLAHPQLTAESPEQGSGNYGLLDMIAALGWVRDNIARFGGAPGEVTVAGQSAGAVAVNDLMVSLPAKGLFARAIAESGSGMGIPALSLEEAERNGVAFAQSLGASNLVELRKLPPETIQAAVRLPIGAAGASDGRPLIPFRPVLARNVLPVDPADPTALVQTKAPLVTGYNADENYWPDTTVSIAVFEKSVRARYGAHAERFLALYPHATDRQAIDSARLLARDRYMASLILWTRRRTQATGQPIYAYLFEHPVPTTNALSWGTFHTAEVPYIFGVLDTHRRPYTESDRKVATQMAGYWLNFIKHGDPNGPALPKWRRLTATDAEVMGLGDHVGTRLAVSSPERLAAFRAYVESGGSLSLF